MNDQNAKEIIINAVRKTEPRWKGKTEFHWNDIDNIFLARSYEAGGFEFYKFYPLLKRNNIASINNIGTILDNYQGPDKYIRELSGSFDSEFYIKMKNGKFGNFGELFFRCVNEFEGKKGAFFWKELWYFLKCCNLLKNKYNASFSYYLKDKYAKFKGLNDISDHDFLKVSSSEWEDFIKEKEPWNELIGIGENMFDYIVGDCVDSEFFLNSYKLDAANMYFFKVTGIEKIIGPIKRENVIPFLKSLKLPYPLREINKGIYNYCSETEKEHYGYCKNQRKCRDCAVESICEKNIL